MHRLMASSHSAPQVTAKSHKSLLPDTTIGTGVIDLAQSAAQSGPTIVPLSGKTGASAGQVVPSYVALKSITSRQVPRRNLQRSRRPSRDPPSCL